MSVTIRATITGLDELSHGLSELSQGRYIQAGLDRSAALVVERARRDRFRSGGGDAVPGILTRRTGALERSIRIQRGRAHRPGGAPGYHDVIFGPGGEHGPFHELGTSRLPRRPVLEPGLHLAAPSFAAIFEEELVREIDRAFAIGSALL